MFEAVKTAKTRPGGFAPGRAYYPKSPANALGFRDFDDFAILVLAAEGAGAVRKHALVATGALCKALGLEVIMGAAL
jgi:hypothetical protein